MERRRKALGLRKQPTCRDEGLQGKEETPKKSELKKNIVSKSSEEKAPINGRESVDSCSESILSDQRTPKRHVQVVQPLGSPGLESVFPRMLGSPEIEVSWDWGCSQVPKDMLPSRLVKQGSPKQPSIVLSPLIQEPRVFQSRQMSEEENQARLAFYKNVLSQATKCKLEAESTSENLDNVCIKENLNITTPKQSTKPIKEDRELLNTLFDDSANEFMLECSQVVEEQLKSGQINIDPVVTINIPKRKHDPSPDHSPENHKRVCPVKSKLNLFSETSRTTNREEKTDNVEVHPSSKSELFKNDTRHIPQSDFICSNGKANLNNEANKISLVQKSDKYINRDSNGLSHITNGKKVPENAKCGALERKPANSIGQSTLNNNSIKLNNTFQTKHGQQNVNNNKYDSVDKFRRNSKSVCVSNQNQNGSKNVPHYLSAEASTTKNSSYVDGNKTTSKGVKNNIQGTNQKVADITSLLDDGFDLELSSLDVDSICLNSQVPVVPKVCTKAEIEAKRRRALARLKMKMKR